MAAQRHRARAAYAARAWEAARLAFARADAASALASEDLERWAMAAYMAGDRAGFVAALERAHRAHLDAGSTRAGIRSAFWLGLHHALWGEMAQASGWLGRSARLLEDEQAPCVEVGYLLLPQVVQAQAMGDWASALEVADRALGVGQRFDDRDLIALALHAKGLSRLKSGQVDEGMALLDEAMVSVVADALSPMVTGIVYCSVIEGCRDAFVHQRAAEWTGALAAWCQGQDGLVAFSGECLMHRADILCLGGAWPEALLEAERAAARFERAGNAGLIGRACYQQAEVRRCQGLLADALALYERAGRRGHEPQPGLALLRLAQGETDAAVAAIRRAVGETGDALARARLLPAYVEIALAAGDVEAAESASAELSAIARAHRTDLLAALAASAGGAVRLVKGDAWAALAELRGAAACWQDLDAPYEAARVRERIGHACRAVGDVDSAGLELGAAHAAFQALGAVLDVERVAAALEAPDALGLDAGAGAAHGLTERELEVLRLVAAGRSNREIATSLSISPHTVARHLQNLFAKLEVTSRTAAGAYAYEHGLIR